MFGRRSMTAPQPSIGSETCEREARAPGPPDGGQRDRLPPPGVWFCVGNAVAKRFILADCNHYGGARPAGQAGKAALGASEVYGGALQELPRGAMSRSHGAGQSRCEMRRR